MQELSQSLAVYGSVDDLATACLMMRCYWTIDGKILSMVEALQSGQTWLKMVSRKELIRYVFVGAQALRPYMEQRFFVINFTTLIGLG